MKKQNEIEEKIEDFKDRELDLTNKYRVGENYGAIQALKWVLADSKIIVPDKIQWHIEQLNETTRGDFGVYMLEDGFCNWSVGREDDTTFYGKILYGDNGKSEFVRKFSIDKETKEITIE